MSTRPIISESTQEHAGCSLAGTPCSGFFLAGWRRAFDAEKDKTEEYCGRQTCTWKCAGIAIRLYDAENRYNQQYGTKNKTNSAD